MKQKKMLALTFSQLKQIYNQEIPEVVEIAIRALLWKSSRLGCCVFWKFAG